MSDFEEPVYEFSWGASVAVYHADDCFGPHQYGYYATIRERRGGPKIFKGPFRKVERAREVAAKEADRMLRERGQEALARPRLFKRLWGGVKKLWES